jgi:(1->4)-alpha-D-glucan 1-alpha-D-glucosylmutase
VATFHQRNLERQARWPHALLPATTHDTKRSEDARARINALSELPSEWRSHISHWSRLNQRRKSDVDGELAPSRNDEYLLYQSLIGTWPFDTRWSLGNPAAAAGNRSGPAMLTLPPRFVDRIQQYMLKAAREAKVHTSWISPHEPYERALQSFVTAILTDSRKNGFLARFEPFARRVAEYGIWNSLSQTVLRLASPGVPDIYQGTELWDFSLVDPDNRRPIDYELRRNLLKAMQDRISSKGHDLLEIARELVASRTSGCIKCFLMSQVLKFRMANPGLFTTAAYIPLEPLGARKENVCGFLRKSSTRAALVVAPRMVASLTGQAGGPPVGPEIWSDTSFPLPGDVTGTALRNVLTGELLPMPTDSSGRSLIVADALRVFPVALLESLQD